MRELYLDNAATTEIDKVVLEKFVENSKKYFANPSSQHRFGRLSKEKLEFSRNKIAKFIGADDGEIYFTSGGTEGNNLILRGLAEANPEKKQIIISKIEHPSILEVCKFLENKGYKIDYLDVDSEGFVNLEQLENKISEDTLLVSIMFVNNEIGTIQDIKRISGICKSFDVLFHTDAVQAFSKLDIDVSSLGIDLLTVSGHKINAPKGVGFVYIKKGIRFKSLFKGGGQEKGIRSGTENLLSVIALSDALDIKENKEKIKLARDKIIEAFSGVKGVILNGPLKNRIYNNINLSFYGVEGESIMLLLDEVGIFVSTGSACNSNKLKGSHVLEALGVEELYINGSIRMTIGELTDEETDFIILKLKEVVKRLSEISPFKLK